MPIPNPAREKERSARRVILSGDPPSPLNPPEGCPFHPRCAYVIEACKAAPPPWIAWDEAGRRRAACIRVKEING